MCPEIAILGADLKEYEPFQEGEVAAIPFINAQVFMNNAAAEMYDG